MAGIRIDVDASKGISSLTDFRKALYDTGIAAKTSDKELGVIADRFRDKLQADRAEAALGLLRKQIEQVGRAAGMSNQEMAALHNRMGTMQTGANQAGGALSSVASVAGKAGLSLGGLATAALGTVTAYMTLKSAAELVAEAIGNAARYETLGVVIQQVGKNAGYTKQEMLDFASGIQTAGISMNASREALSKMATAQLDLTKSTQLARIAQDAAVISGKNSSEAFERIVQGITNGQTVLLRHQGIMVDLEDAYKKYARQLGISKDDLSEAQRRQAALNAVLETGATRAGVYEAAMMTAGKQITSFQRYIEDFKTTMGTAFLDSFTDTVFNATDAMKLLQAEIAKPEAQQALAAIANGIAVMANAIIASVPPAIDAISKLVSALVAAKNAIADYKNMLPEMFGAFGDGAVAAIDFFKQAGPQTASPLLYAMTSVQTQAKKITENGVDKKELKAQADALSDYWAAWEKGKNDYKNSTSSAVSIGEDSKNAKFLPIPQQVFEEGKRYKTQLEGISAAWKSAYDKGQWEDVEKINRSATVATGQHADALEKLDNKANKGRKSAESAANAAARYESQSAQALQQALDQYDQLQATYAGDSLGAKLAAIDKKYNTTAASLERSMIGAKGSTEEARAALDQLAKNKALEVLIAQADAWRKSMQDAANLLGELGRLSGDPSAIYGSTMTTAKLWEADQQKRIAAIEDVTEREKQASELRQVMALKDVAARADAYEGMAAVSSKYWDAERALLDQHLAVVKANADDELAFRVYAAQQEDELRKKQLESEAAYAGTFGETLAAKWSLAFGGYKSEMTRSKESWNDMSDSIVTATDGMIDGIAGGFGDMIRNIGNGTASIEDLWKNMLSRMLDAFASFVEDLIKSQLKDLVGGMLGGNGSSGSGFSLSKLFGGSSSSSSSGSGGGFDLSSIGSMFKGFGKDAGVGMGEYFSTAGESASLMVAAGSKNYLSDIFSEGIDASKLGANIWASQPVNAISEATQASTYASGIGSLASTGTSLLSTIGTTLGVVGAIGGLVGLAASLFGGEEKKKKEPVKLYDGTAQSWSGGNTMSYSMEVMDDGTMKQKTVQPGDLQEMQKAFKDLTDTVKDAAKVLKIDLVENFVTNFSFMTGVISDELSDTASWVMQGKLGGEALGELYNAVMFFSDGMQNVVEIFTGLASSASLVKGSIESLGIDFGKFSGVDDRYLEAVADFAVNGIGPITEALDGIASSALSASEYLAKYSDQLRALAEAQMASLYEDALGGEDQFKSAMTTYATYGVTTKDQKMDSLNYYTNQLGELLGEFEENFSDVLTNFSGANIDITDIDSFWSAYNAAMQQSMSPSMLAAWAEMASYAQLISTTSDELDAVNLKESQWSTAIAARRQIAAGMDKEAALTKQMAGYEKELADARADGMTYLQQAALVQAQIDEMQAQYNELVGVEIDYTSSMDAALNKFIETVTSVIDRLSEVTSTASSLASTWEGVSSGLDSAIESMRDDVIIDFTSTINSKMALLDDAFAKGMAGDADSMAKVSGYATSAWESVKKGASTPEQYDTAYWTIQNRLATAKAESTGMTEYEKTTSSLTGELVNIADEIKKELESDNPDPAFLQQAKTLYAYTEDFQKYVDLYNAGRISEEEFNQAALNSSASLEAWISTMVAQDAKLSADQVRALVSENDFISQSVLTGANMTSEQVLALQTVTDAIGKDTLSGILSNSINLQTLIDGYDGIAGLTDEQNLILQGAVHSLDFLYNSDQEIGAGTIQAIMGNEAFLKAIMEGSVQLSGLSVQQANLLSSSLTVMEEVSKYTGQNLVYSDKAAYYLAKINDGLATAKWDTLIDTIKDGQTELQNALLWGIGMLNATMYDLTLKAADQEATTAAQSKYFEGIEQLLYKQTQIELYTSLAQTAKNTATGYENYAMSALLTGTSMGMIVFAQWMEKYNVAKAEADSMEAQLNYWQNLELPALASGGVVTSPTLAYVGEGGESEAIIPLSKLDNLISASGSDDETKQLLAAILKELRANTSTTQIVADRVYDRDKNKPFAARQ